MSINFSRERERESNIGWLPPACTPIMDRTHNLGMYPDQESNCQPPGAQNNAPTNWAMQPGPKKRFLLWSFSLKMIVKNSEYMSQVHEVSILKMCWLFFTCLEKHKLNFISGKSSICPYE